MVGSVSLGVVANNSSPFAFKFLQPETHGPFYKFARQLGSLYRMGCAKQESYKPTKAWNTRDSSGSNEGNYLVRMLDTNSQRDTNRNVGCRHSLPRGV
jgi:hypothetical protein